MTNDVPPDHSKKLVAGIIPRFIDEWDRITRNADATEENAHIHYRLKKTSTLGHMLTRIDDPDFDEFFTHAQIAELEKTPGWRHERDYFTPENAEILLKAGGERQEDMPRNKCRRVLFKQLICDFLIAGIESNKFTKSDRGLKKAIKEIFEKHRNALDALQVRRRTDGVGVDSYMPKSQNPS